jgi:hypothetical protein
MTFPSFSVGETLRAADMNAVGLWLVKTQTVGTGVSSVTVTGAFSADYDNYLITYTGGTLTVDGNMHLKLGSTTTGYFGSLVFGNYAANTVSGVGENNVGQFSFVGGGQPNGSCTIQILSPFLAASTEVSARVRYATVYGNYVGVIPATTSFTSFILNPASGTMTGGTIRVYGYRN